MPIRLFVRHALTGARIFVPSFSREDDGYSVSAVNLVANLLGKRVFKVSDDGEVDRTESHLIVSVLHRSGGGPASWSLMLGEVAKEDFVVEVLFGSQIPGVCTLEADGSWTYMNSLCARFP